jgi:3D (Asp-Asp-Asp) domain-containing protein
MYATSYHPAALAGDAVTATGRALTKGIIASDPDVIPYDSQVYVPGYGVGIMADTGAFSRRLHIDLGYDDANFVSWSRWVDVYLLAPAPDPSEIPYLLPQSE